MIRVLVGGQNCSPVFRDVLTEALMIAAALHSFCPSPSAATTTPWVKETRVHPGWQLTQVPTSKSGIKMQKGVWTSLAVNVSDLHPIFIFYFFILF